MHIGEKTKDRTLNVTLGDEIYADNKMRYFYGVCVNQYQRILYPENEKVFNTKIILPKIDPLMTKF